MNVRNSGCCAVIASYNPEPGLVRNVAALLGQLTNVIVVDNGSSSESEITLSNVAQMPGCVVIRLGTNKGIAHALNSGIRAALESNFEWIFTFDQDSSVSSGFVSSMLAALYGAPDANNVAIVAPHCLDRNYEFHIRFPRSAKGEVLEVITSGNLVPATVFRRIGLFDETLFMDFVDIEFLPAVSPIRSPYYRVARFRSAA